MMRNVKINDCSDRNNGVLMVIKIFLIYKFQIV